MTFLFVFLGVLDRLVLESWCLWEAFDVCVGGLVYWDGYCLFMVVYESGDPFTMIEYEQQFL